MTGDCAKNRKQHFFVLVFGCVFSCSSHRRRYLVEYLFFSFSVSHFTCAYRVFRSTVLFSAWFFGAWRGSGMAVVGRRRAVMRRSGRRSFEQTCEEERSA